MHWEVFLEIQCKENCAERRIGLVFINLSSVEKLRYLNWENFSRNLAHRDKQKLVRCEEKQKPGSNGDL